MPLHPLLTGALLALTVAGPGPVPQAALPARVQATPWTFFDLLREAAPGAGADASGFRLEKDAAVLDFRSGTLTLVEVQGAVVGAVFAGAGSLTHTPPDAVERSQVARILSGPVAEVEIAGALLLFGPATADRLRASLAFGAPSADGTFSRVLEQGVKYLRDERTRTVDAEVVRTFLNGEGRDFLHAHLEAARGGPSFFRFSTLRTKEVAFGRRADGRGDYYETLNDFESVLARVRREGW
ncbi:MAG: hypothetical protein RQ751_11260 [Longimicrobiales bacterium]|nr:hypothetical protein [Longimicrobiales bacterium]